MHPESIDRLKSACAQADEYQFPMKKACAAARDTSL
jgi:hypothetical protein